MSGPHDAELQALRDAINASKAVATEPAPPVSNVAAEPSREDSELVTVLRELKDGLVQAADGADELIAKHPGASVGAAFLLGLAVGRLMRGI